VLAQPGEVDFDVLYDRLLTNTPSRGLSYPSRGIAAHPQRWAPSRYLSLATPTGLLFPQNPQEPGLTRRVRGMRGPKRVDMGTVIPLREPSELAITERCLAQTDRCILRQLHLISYLDRRRSNLSLAANTLKHMLIAHHLLEKHRKQLERDLRGPWL
jgi:hypothetical protein